MAQCMPVFVSPSPALMRTGVSGEPVRLIAPPIACAMGSKLLNCA